MTTGAVTDQSLLVGKTVEEVGLWATYGVNLLMLREARGDVQPAPCARRTLLPGKNSCSLGASDQIARFAADHGLEPDPEIPEWLEEALSESGFAEVVVVPRRRSPARASATSPSEIRIQSNPLSCSQVPNPSPPISPTSPFPSATCWWCTAAGNTSDRSRKTQASTYSPRSKAKKPTRPRASPPPSASPAPWHSRSPAFPSPLA